MVNRYRREEAQKGGHQVDEEELKRVVEQAMAEEAAGLSEAASAFVKGLLNGRAVEAEKAFRAKILSFGGKLAGKAMERADGELRRRLRRRGHRDEQGKQCRGRLRSKGIKDKTIQTLLGDMEVGRWTCECADCGKWMGSVEELLGVENGMSAACGSVTGMAAVTVAYAPAEEVLWELAGIRVDDNCIQRMVGVLSRHAEPWMRETAEKLPSKESLPGRGERAYVLMDGGRIRLREEGSNPWREPCTALVVWERSEGKWVRYGSSDPCNKEPVIKWLDKWMELLQRGGMEVVIIADGAEWIWQWALKYPWAIPILDYYHLKENVWKAARVLHGEGTPEAAGWVRCLMDGLWRGQVDATIEMLDETKVTGPTKEQKCQALDRLIAFLDTNDYLIKYAHHRRAGRWTGSGTIESFCKQLFTMRMKGPGMFWTESGARALMTLRTVYLTGHWGELWNSHRRVA